MSSSGAGNYALAARLNRAKLDADSGREADARAAYDALIRADPADPLPRLGRAHLALRSGHPEAAMSDLGCVLERSPRDVEARTLRALAFLALNQPGPAESDSAEALRLDPTPRRRRLHDRALLAIGAVDSLSFDDPADLRRLPGRAGPLRADLRVAAERLRGRGNAAEATRAVILAALRDPSAETEASRAVEANPNSARSLMIRARVRRERGDHAGASADVARGLALEPDDPRLLGLRAEIDLDEGRAAEALAGIDRAFQTGGSNRLHRPRALALDGLGRPREALAEWNRVVAIDPDDPSAILGRASALARLGKDDQALADLERATELAADRPDTLASITLVYLRLLPRHPDRAGKLLALASRAVSRE